MSVDAVKAGEVMRKVREMLMPHYGNVEHTSKSEQAYDIVTELDVKVETFLRDELGKLYPEIAFVGEETGGDRTAQRKWLCDPIDGTSHFVRGTPFCTSMIALIEDEQVTFSIIYDFVTDTLYHAVKGGGAFANGKPIHVSDRSLKGSYLSWETHLLRNDNLKTHLALVERSSFFKTICAGYEFVLVATGKIEGRITFDPFGKDYDFAAGSLLVAEAGGVVANIGKTDYDYRNLDFLAVNPVVYTELTEGDRAVFPHSR